MSLRMAYLPVVTTTCERNHLTRFKDFYLKATFRICLVCATSHIVGTYREARNLMAGDRAEGYGVVLDAVVLQAER